VIFSSYDRVGCWFACSWEWLGILHTKPFLGGLVDEDANHGLVRASTIGAPRPTSNKLVRMTELSY
jgi:hypothetical protein